MYVYRIMSSKELVNRLNGINTNDLVDGIKSQMGFIFADTFKNGFLLSNGVVSLSETIDVYNTIINNMPNITDIDYKTYSQ